MDGAERVHASSPKAARQGQRPEANDGHDDTACVADGESLPAQQAGHDNNNNAHLFVFSNSKAGMKNVDKERVNRVIYEMSKNSSYFKQAQLQDQKLDGKVRHTCARETLLQEYTGGLKFNFDEFAIFAR